MKYGEKAIKESKFELWDNPYKNRNYKVDITFPEFTCLCPRSGYPDFATVKITYIPRRYIVELKSVKLYLNKFRNQHISHESAINQIFSDIYRILKPKFLEVTGDFNPRGNVKTTIRIDSETLKIHSL